MSLVSGCTAMSASIEGSASTGSELSATGVPSDIPILRLFSRDSPALRTAGPGITLTARQVLHGTARSGRWVDWARHCGRCSADGCGHPARAVSRLTASLIGVMAVTALRADGPPWRRDGRRAGAARQATKAQARGDVASTGDISAGSMSRVRSKPEFLDVSTWSGRFRSTQSAVACSPLHRRVVSISALWTCMPGPPRHRCGSRTGSRLCPAVRKEHPLPTASAFGLA
jgi:hypothetical protein